MGVCLVSYKTLRPPFHLNIQKPMIFMKKTAPKTHLLMLVAGLLLPFGVLAQGKAVFEKTRHDFGNIKETSGEAVVEFKFTNKGTASISLVDVKASCGCTTPSWSKAPVLPGETGFVKASYNPMNRPGHFDKAVTVRTDGEPEILVLTITGNVEPRPKGPQDHYPMEIGSLRFKTTHLVFGNVLHDGADTASTVLYNQGSQAVNLLLAETKLPPHMKLQAEKTTLQPQETAMLSFTYDARQVKDWGYVFEDFELKTDDADRPAKRINISASIKENFGAQAASSPQPKLRLDKTTHRFGDVAKNTSVSTTFTITNDGKAPLIIRKTKPSCGCTASNPKKSELAPGESTTIDVTFSTGDRAGIQKKSINVIVNDPSSDNNTLFIEANVLENTASQAN